MTRPVFGEGELGYIAFGPSRRIQLTWDDMLWSARMLIGETGGGGNAYGIEGAAVLWCMASRAGSAGVSSYTNLIQRYSQPINPKWGRDGEFCRPGGRYHGQDVCSPVRLDRRDRILLLAWEDIDERICSYVVEWGRGRVANPVPRAIHFAVPRVASSLDGVASGEAGLAAREGGLQIVWDSLGRGPDSIAGNGNTFYSNSRSRDWQENKVRVVFNDSIAQDNAVARGVVALPLGEGSESSPSPAETRGASLSVSVPEPDILDRISAITSDRTEAPNTSYSYVITNGESGDPSAQEQLSADLTERMVRTPYERFYNQVIALKGASNIDMTMAMPVIHVFAENDDGDIVDLNEKIFQQGTFHSIFEGEEQNPERPLASIDEFKVSVTPTQFGLTTLNMATLSIKIHNAELVRPNHPKGKFIQWMMVQGYTMRIRWGMNSPDDFNNIAFQWKEEDFSVTQYQLDVAADKTAMLHVEMMPATRRLLGQLHIGESIPSNTLGELTTSDINDIVTSVTSDDPDSTPDEVEEVRRRLTNFREQLNLSAESPGTRLISYGSGTFGSTLRAAIGNSNIFDEPEGLAAHIIPNMVDSLRTIQAVLLTRRFQQLLTRNAYSQTYNGVTSNRVNIGPLFMDVAVPELNAAIGYVSQNNIEIGEKYSIDDFPTNQKEPRINLKVVFGRFNERAGEWAGKPISTFPINVDTMFSEIRSRRTVGDFSMTFNHFVQLISRQAHELENYAPDRESGTRRFEAPNVRFTLYPDPTDISSWIFYLYDNKTDVIRFRLATEAIRENEESHSGARITRNELSDIMSQQRVPYLEMGEEGTIIRNLSAQTQTDDLIASRQISLANASSLGTRDLDRSPRVPAGVSRDFIAGTVFNNNDIATSSALIIPLRVSLDLFIVPTMLPFSPMFVFFPVNMFTGIYTIMEITHQIKGGTSMTRATLQLELGSVPSSAPADDEPEG